VDTKGQAGSYPVETELIPVLWQNRPFAAIYKVLETMSDSSTTPSPTFAAPVTAAQALQELGATRLQIHTISRVTQAQNCMAVAAPVVAPVQPEQFILSTDTLFAFGRSDLNGLTASGRESLDVLTSRIRNTYVRVDKVHVIGHADPLGSPDSNERLSVNRANTVRQYLITNGQISAPVTSEGKGARQLVETRCARQPTSASLRGARSGCRT
jgi:outer membrane protein OmpA-like peptidoglycan-associated protein